ncbi:conserved hypothetical protein [Pyrobaculum islandicum DSM 4184]|uniref:Uncharacterized protein n=1 Tax=Pyrobaculum islandicum (strain DSM 4184 / JCM 9189 / GEO3) TaxID=384616 RepID=A1RQW4_PYRIL|nr:hypothetical protein [Pyrobaculum islandicum]ABL87346.1 conserved hypothetical protein [Pyrobaculum islandicum DSM 4184]
MSRSTVPVEGDVAREVASLAKSHGFSVVRLATDSLKLAIELMKRGVTPVNALEMYKLLEKIIAFDVVPVPLSFLELLAKKWDICNNPEIEHYLKEIGEKFGKTLLSEFKNFNEFVRVASLLFAQFPTTRFTINKTGNVWRIYFAPAGPLSARCLARFAEEVIKQFGCVTKTQYNPVIAAEVECPGKTL